MERNITKQLLEWKASKNRKPLILQGARQVGKTYIMKHFGSQYFDNFVYFNFDENQKVKALFENTKEASRLIEQLSLIAEEPIYPQKTLIILDEIQECSAALNSLKYFKENAPEYAVISAGSLLGVLLAKPQSYPVGQVNIIDIYPMTFDEFLLAANKSLYGTYLKIGKGTEIPEVVHDKLNEAYRTYLTIGGLPEAVKSWVSEKNPKEVSRIHKELAEIYEADISKHHADVNPARIQMVLRNIVAQLSKENKKFIYGAIKSGARAREFEEAIEWLVSARLLNRVYCATKNDYSLASYDDLSAFKLYFFDTGILKYMAGLTSESIVLDEPFGFKGALTENYVLQQLQGQFELAPRYFTFDRYEIDFLLQNGSQIIPVEVKSSSNIISASSAAYKKRFCPPIYIRYSSLNYKHDGTTLNIPLYLIGKTRDLLSV